jgi:hypothetical protein
VLVVLGIFVLMFALAFAGYPTKLIPEPTPFSVPSVPVPSVPGSGEPSASP